jgi:hypothetical protein
MLWEQRGPPGPEAPRLRRRVRGGALDYDLDSAVHDCGPAGRTVPPHCSDGDAAALRVDRRRDHLALDRPASTMTPATGHRYHPHCHCDDLDRHDGSGHGHGHDHDHGHGRRCHAKQTKPKIRQVRSTIAFQPRNDNFRGVRVCTTDALLQRWDADSVSNTVGAATTLPAREDHPTTLRPKKTVGLQVVPFGVPVPGVVMVLFTVPRRAVVPSGRCRRSISIATRLGGRGDGSDCRNAAFSPTTIHSTVSFADWGATRQRVNRRALFAGVTPKKHISDQEAESGSSTCAYNHARVAQAGSPGYGSGHHDRQQRFQDPTSASEAPPAHSHSSSLTRRWSAFPGN